jgi:2,3-dihydroxybenzoate decarboxylase
LQLYFASTHAPPLSAAPPPNTTLAQFHSNLFDLADQRLRYMDAAGVDYMVVSLTSPGVQDTANQSLAESLATRANDEFARLIANNTARYGAFAAVSMHNVTQAGEELRRAVTELGFLGALVNDFQTAGSDNSALRACLSPNISVAD